MTSNLFWENVYCFEMDKLERIALRTEPENMTMKPPLIYIYICVCVCVCVCWLVRENWKKWKYAISIMIFMYFGHGSIVSLFIRSRGNIIIFHAVQTIDEVWELLLKRNPVNVGLHRINLTGHVVWLKGNQNYWHFTTIFLTMYSYHFVIFFTLYTD